MVGIISMAELAPAIAMWKVLLGALAVMAIIMCVTKVYQQKKVLQPVQPETFAEPVIGSALPVENNSYVPRQPVLLDEQMDKASNRGQVFRIASQPVGLVPLPGGRVEAYPLGNGDASTRQIRRGAAKVAGVHHSRVSLAMSPAKPSATSIQLQTN
jgi:hypothetical protein